MVKNSIHLQIAFLLSSSEPVQIVFKFSTSFLLEAPKHDVYMTSKSAWWKGYIFYCAHGCSSCSNKLLEN